MRFKVRMFSMLLPFAITFLLTLSINSHLTSANEISPANEIEAQSLYETGFAVFKNALLATADLPIKLAISTCDLFNDAIKLSPYNAKYWNELACCQYYAGLTDLSASSFRNINVSEEHIRRYLFLAKWHRMSNNPVRSIGMRLPSNVTDEIHLYEALQIILPYAACGAVVEPCPAVPQAISIDLIYSQFHQSVDLMSSPYIINPSYASYIAEIVCASPQMDRNTKVVEVLKGCVNELIPLIKVEFKYFSPTLSPPRSSFEMGHFPLELRYNALLGSLDDISSAQGESQEGGIWNRHDFNSKNFKHDVKDMIPPDADGEIKRSDKRSCFLTSLGLSLPVVGTSHYLEIGFNVGHSSGMVLSTFENVHITAFDYCYHSYTLPSFVLLQEKFGYDRMQLSCGDTMTSIEEYKMTHPTALGIHDAVLIDGGHRYDQAYSDIINSLALLKPNALMIIDDCTTDVNVNKVNEDGADRAVTDVMEIHVGLAFRHAVANGFIVPVASDVCGMADFCTGRYSGKLV